MRSGGDRRGIIAFIRVSAHGSCLTPRPVSSVGGVGDHSRSRLACHMGTRPTDNAAQPCAGDRGRADRYSNLRFLFDR